MSREISMLNTLPAVALLMNSYLTIHFLNSSVKGPFVACDAASSDAEK